MLANILLTWELDGPIIVLKLDPFKRKRLLALEPAFAEDFNIATSSGVDWRKLRNFCALSESKNLRRVALLLVFLNFSELFFELFIKEVFIHIVGLLLLISVDLLQSEGKAVVLVDVPKFSSIIFISDVGQQLPGRVLGYNKHVHDSLERVVREVHGCTQI